MKPEVERDLAALQEMTAAGLRGKYQELFGEQSRSGNRQWLLRRCAWRLQALAEGDLSQRARQRAAQIANDADIRFVAPRQPAADEAAPKRVVKVKIRQEDRLPVPGSTLRRVFKGREYVVIVRRNGFDLDGRFYKSLTAVAHAITGSHWNGFHFFQESLTNNAEVA